MKKIILILLIVGLALNTYADTMTVGDRAFTVLSVKGNVKYEISNSKWALVTLDTLLTSNSNINTGINSALEIQLDDEDIITIKAMKKGTIEELLTSNKVGFSGLKLSGSLTKSSANADDVQERTNIGTASTRASDATEDIQWIEDEEDVLDNE